jgi:hypothetical protein
MTCVLAFGNFLCARTSSVQSVRQTDPIEQLSGKLTGQPSVER